MSVTLDLDLISATLRFWSKDFNSFIFSFSPASITLRDISNFTGLPVEGSKVVCLLDVNDPYFPHLEVSSTSKLLTHPSYGNGELLLGYVLPHST